MGEPRGLDAGLGDGDTFGLLFILLLCNGLIAVVMTVVDLMGDVCCI